MISLLGKTKPKEEPKPQAHKTLVVSLTRFGDLLQLQPALAGLARAGETPGLLCIANFLPAACLLSGPAAAFGLPGSNLLAALEGGWQPALAGLTGFVDTVCERFAPTRVLNLTSSIPARLLSKLIAARLNLPGVDGFGMDAHGFGLDSNPWASFLQAASLSRGTSPFNVSDLFFRAAGLSGKTRPYALNQPSREIRQAISDRLRQAAPQAKGFVALQLGASDFRRRWPLSSFAALGKLIRDQLGLVPVLLGGPGEASLAEKYAARDKGKTVSLIGETGFPELAAALTCCKALVTNDTGTMHLAAGLSVPVLALFLATAQPFDTAPYAENSLCLEPDIPCHPCSFGVSCDQDYLCRRVISPEAVGDYLGAFLDTGSWSALPPPQVRAWVTRRDEHGQMVLLSPSGHNATARARWMEIQRHFFRQFLDGEPCRPPKEGLSSPPEPEAVVIQETLDQAGLILKLLIEQGNLLLSMPRDKAKQKFLATWQRLRTLFADSPHLGALAFLWSEHSHRAEDNLPQFLNQAKRFADLIEALRAVV